MPDEYRACVADPRQQIVGRGDRFKTDGWIRLEGRMIAICEPQALRARAGDGSLPEAKRRGVKG